MIIINRIKGKCKRSQGELLMTKHPIITKSNTAPELYRDLFSPQHDPTREFILKRCTYEEVYRLAVGIWQLQSQRKENPTLICLCTDNKALIAAAIIASLAEGPHIVLPYAFSRQAVKEVFEILSPSLILTDQQVDFPPGAEVITPSMLHYDNIIPDIFHDPDEPFLLLFTGGSTGKPKAWPKTPRNILAEAGYLAGKFSITPDDLFLSTAPPQHIYGFLFSVMIPFMSSSCVLDGVYSFPREILRAIQDHRASILVSIPVHYRVLKVADLQRHNLRMAFSSAGVLDKEDAAYFHSKTGLDITEIYGSTETGGVASRSRSRDGESWRSLDPVAWKIRKGRLHVRSSFISPTLPRNTDGFFATADRADYESDERFILRGRADNIVKIGGKRVDLSAVQAKLKQIPGVRDALVVAIPTGKGTQNKLAALVETDLDELQLRRDIALVSESYAVPKRIVVVEEIPMTYSGKYDRKVIEQILLSGKQNADSSMVPVRGT
jgi:acyl-coenzyme A synthetase/AMP-(fatty) acid ligase